MARYKKRGFTIVELAIVVAVIGILAVISAVGFGAWSQRTTENVMKNDLFALASVMESSLNADNTYPSSVPGEFKPSNGNVIQLVGASDTYFCADIYNASLASTILSYDSSGDSIRSYPCSGLPSGSPVGGTIPNAPRDVNLSGDFENWQLSGTASVSGSILTLGTSGTAISPLIRVSSPTNIRVGGDLKADQQATYISYQPNAGYHVGSQYFASDGTTSVTNNTGHTGNGCAKSFTRVGWQAGINTCVWSGGPSVIYMRLIYYSSALGYTSPDLQVRNPLVTVND